jgi:hypothetical protein
VKHCFCSSASHVSLWLLARWTHDVSSTMPVAIRPYLSLEGDHGTADPLRWPASTCSSDPHLRPPSRLEALSLLRPASEPASPSGRHAHYSASTFR